MSFHYLRTLLQVAQFHGQESGLLQLFNIRATGRGYIEREKIVWAIYIYRAKYDIFYVQLYIHRT